MKYCKNCGSAHSDEAGFCPVCGAAIDGVQMNVAASPVQQDRKGKRKGFGILKAAGIIVVVIVVIFLGLMLLGDDESVEEEIPVAEEQIGKEEAQSGSILEFYQNLQEKSSYPYTLNEQSEAFLQKHEDFFPVKNPAELTNFVDPELDYRHLNKSISKYGDKLFYQSSMYVLDIDEITMTEDTVLTTMQVLDEDGNSFIVLYRGELPDVFEEDTVSVYGLPLGLTSFDNVGGGTTLGVVLAGSSVSNEELDLSKYLAGTAEEMITNLGLNMKKEEGEIIYYTGYDGGLSISGQMKGELSISLNSEDVGMSLWGVKPGMDMEETLQNLSSEGHEIYYGFYDRYFCMMKDYECLVLTGDENGKIRYVIYEDSPLRVSDFGPNADPDVWEGDYSGYDTESGIYLFDYNPDYEADEFVYFSYGNSEKDIDRRDLKAYWTEGGYDNIVEYEDDSIYICLCFMWDGSIRIFAQSPQYGLDDEGSIEKI